MRKPNTIARIVLATALAAAFATALLLCACTDEPSEPADGSADVSSPVDSNDAINPVSNSDDELDYDAIADAMQPMAILVMEANGRQFYPSFEDTEAAAELKERLNAGMLELSLDNDDGAMKSGRITWELPASDEEITVQPGDVVLSQGDTLCLCYSQVEGSFTPLLSTDYFRDEDFADALGSGNVTLRFWLEWTE